MIGNTIPPITDPMGRSWRQPPTSSVVLDDTHALMSRSTFDELPEYSSSYPTGVYPGKMWKAGFPGCWMLRWYGEVPGRPNLCSNNQREILLADGELPTMPNRRMLS